MVGAELPPGEDGKLFLIKVGKLRGVESQGMLCSARELKLSEDHGGLMELPLDAPLGTNIREYLDLDDTLFTLKLTPNLAHCLSVYGVAREVSALTGAPLLAPEFPQASVAIQDKVAVKISAPDLCGRFSGRSHPQRQYQGQYTAMDGGSFGSLWPTQCQSFGRYFELRHVRARPPQPHF